MKNVLLQVIHNEKTEDEASFPYQEGSYALPDRFPFNANIYVGPDAGFNLKTVNVTEDGRIQFGYNDIVEIQNGVGEYDLKIKGEPYRFVFRIKE